MLQSPNTLFCYRILIGSARATLATISGALRVFRNAFHQLLHRSDNERWANPSNLETWWDSRTEKIACLIPKGSRVIEFGAGRRQLEEYLDSSCTYVPSDLVDRGSGTIVFDLNRRPLPDLTHVHASVAVFSGVLEYISDLPSLVQWLNNQVTFCVLSYAITQSKPKTLKRLLERFTRTYYGYMNNLTEEELVDLFNNKGFVSIEKDQWNSQLIFLFAQRSQTSGTSA